MQRLRRNLCLLSLYIFVVLKLETMKLLGAWLVKSIENPV